jgi:hypothetical protein
MDSNNIFSRWRNYFCLLLNVHGFNDVKLTELRTAEPLVIVRTSLQDEIDIENLENRCW